MSFSISVLETGLHDWVEGVTGRAVAFEHPNVPKRPGNICTMLLSPETPVGRDARTYRDQDPAEGLDVWERIESHRRVGVSLNLMRGPVADDMAKLKASVQQWEWMALLHQARLGFVSASDTRDLTEIIHESDWETRLQADFLFSTAYETEAEVTTIEKIDITNAGTGEVISVVPAA